MGPDDAGLRSPPAHASFGTLLRWHLEERGTRPSGRAGRPGKRWARKDFAFAVGVHDRTLRDWLKNSYVPNDLIAIERVLFGERIEEYSEFYQVLCLGLRAAHERTRLELKGQLSLTEKEPRPKVGIDAATAATLAELRESNQGTEQPASAHKQNISELAADAVNTVPDVGNGRTRDDFTIAGRWNSEGLEITGGHTVIPAVESMRLFRALFDNLPSMFEQERNRAGEEDLIDRALLLATLRACCTVYGRVPDEQEMQRASSVLSRKLNLFGMFAKHLYDRACQGGVNLEEFLFNELREWQSGTTSGDDVENPSNFPRICLQMYIKRSCDADLDKVETFENIMQNSKLNWESMVEDVYFINEEQVFVIYQKIKLNAPEISEEEIFALISQHIIRSQIGLDVIIFRNRYMEK